MKTHTKAVTTALTAFIFGTTLAGVALAQPATPPTHAHITMQRARTIALAARPGRIVAQELERERGGSGLRYSFDIRSARTVYEIGVDANTGVVLENAPEGPHPD